MVGWRVHPMSFVVHHIAVEMQDGLAVTMLRCNCSHLKGPHPSPTVILKICHVSELYGDL